MSTIHLPFALPAVESERKNGFRLERFEVYNWGTFHERVWNMEPQGKNALITGDIGSGKSTLVDALTTLLVAPKKVEYNKAAGAENRERDLRSYVAGYYKSERGDPGLSAKPVALRDRNAYTVILGRFYAAEYDQCITLALVCWTRDKVGQPERLYCIADGRLSIAEHFSGFGEIRELRNRMREHKVELYDSFSSYGAAYRRRFGIADEQAMDLFHQTVSMKSVGNLTEFVREHMLAAFDMEKRIRDLITHFDDLNRAHDAVLIAKDQIERLTPLIVNCDSLAMVKEENLYLTKCREVLRGWFASLKAELLRLRLLTYEGELERLNNRITTCTTQRKEILRTKSELDIAIAANGGDRLDQLTRKIESTKAELAHCRRRCEQYEAFALQVKLAPPDTFERFATNRQIIVGEGTLLEQTRLQADDEKLTEFLIQRDNEKEAKVIFAELESLRGRRSNLPKDMLDLRARLCTALSLEDDTLPFVGELLAVRPDEADWEGAAERVLRSFGLSLLVPTEHYEEVSRWVDRTHLRGRLVYYRVQTAAHRAAQYLPDIDPASLLAKLVFAPHTPFEPWLQNELYRRFNYICCDTMERFRREPRALTQSGHLKTSNERHEKDDRHQISDRSRYILGWTNEAKIVALESQWAALHKTLALSREKIGQIEVRLKAVQARKSVIDQLSTFVHFVDIDWRPIAAAVAGFEAERRQLAEGSDILRTLEERLSLNEANMQQIEAEYKKLLDADSTTKQKMHNASELLRDCETLLQLIPSDIQAEFFPRLQLLRMEVQGQQQLTVEACDPREREMRDWLQAKIDASVRRSDRLREAIVRAMQEYLHRYPTEAQELDAAVVAAEGYRQVLQRLQTDDLPQFEARFKELLNENAIREIANFQSQLNRELHTTVQRIEAINRSLRDIDYNPGRFIVLEAESSHDAEIRDFRRDLRSCTEGSLTGSDDQHYAEAKFLQVKRIVERFRGREGSGEIDRRWTRKVTDVRNWQLFSASERWREDNREHEHYTDSGGKSGGQKEKLAYTVLAASVAYQFGLERPGQRSFRLVVIDEAFGRGSDESARFGLELFKRLDLQLMVVTPLQKIRVIEPFVSAVTFVHNDGRQSQLHNLTIEEYLAERAARGG